MIVVHSADGGRTWREVAQSEQYGTDPEGPPAFSFLDALRGWMGWEYLGESKIVMTRDRGQHWETVSAQSLQTMQMFDDRRGYGKLAGNFYRTDDGGRSWVETRIQSIVFIDRVFFLTTELGWITGTSVGGKEFVVLRTDNGGRDWEESRGAPPQGAQTVRDLFFLDPQRGWLLAWGNDFRSYFYSTVDGGKNWTMNADLSRQWTRQMADVVRFTSPERGFVFLDDRLMYTIDGGTRWRSQPLPKYVYNCDVFEGDLLCSSGPGFRLLTVHPK